MVHDAGERGVSLFELSLVTALLGLGAALALIPLQGMADHHALQGAAEGVVSVLTTARLQAMTGNRSIQLRVHEDGRRYSLVGPGAEPALWRLLPAGVEFSPGSRPPTFHSRGHAAPAGSFTLRNRSGGVSIFIAASGRTRWERIP